MSDLLHHDDGTHRSTAPTTNGRELERFERQMRRHTADGHTHRPREWRIGVYDPEVGGVFWYDQPHKGMAMTVYRILLDYAREGVKISVQFREPEGPWQTEAGASLLVSEGA